MLTLRGRKSGEGAGVCSVTVMIGFGDGSWHQSLWLSPIYLYITIYKIMLHGFLYQLKCKIMILHKPHNNITKVKVTKIEANQSLTKRAKFCNNTQ